MGDPCLNSIHLEAPRRQQFRLAREALLNARGGHTIAAQSQQELADLTGHMPGNVKADPALAATGVRFWLIDSEGAYPLHVGINAVGRSADCDVVVQDAFVSRRHCAVLVHATCGCELHDIASKNGTFLNGVKLTGPTHLHSGDEIRMCGRQFVFLEKTGNEPPPASSATQMDEPAQ
jgi:pSer/pThr/pTyr-binding forkhead associated (FHA) protein